MALKKNRSETYTVGLCNTFKDSKLKVLFFELDKEHSRNIDEVKYIFIKNELDYFIHRTGSGGYHFLSPTLMSAGRWHYIIQEVKHLNKECPMNTLRTKPNKYYQEDYYWYQIIDQRQFDNEKVNSLDLCILFNRLWKTQFKGIIPTEIIQPPYPLPISDYVR